MVKNNNIKTSDVSGIFKYYSSKFTVYIKNQGVFNVISFIYWSVNKKE